jgi:hypothetical protein
MSEVRNSYEGELRWVVASGTGVAWATASAPASGLIGYVTDVNFTSAQTIETVMDRGIPDHHKIVDKQPITTTFNLNWGVTADYPTFVSGSGASMPMIHLELKSKQPERGADSGLYIQIHGCALEQFQFNETSPVNTQNYSVRGLAMVGPTASGYLG